MQQGQKSVVVNEKTVHGTIISGSIRSGNRVSFYFFSFNIVLTIPKIDQADPGAI